MASEYLAMYLTVGFHPGERTTVPIRLFAESTARLSHDIRQDAYFTKLEEANDALMRVMAPAKRNQIQLAVLLLSTLPATRLILAHQPARRQMKEIIAGVHQVLTPPAVPVVIFSPEVRVTLRYGMKRRTTEFPNPFVSAANFTSKMGNIETTARVSERVGGFQNEVFVVLVFDQPSRDVFANTA